MGITLSKKNIIPNNEVEKIINKNNENLEIYFNNNFMNYEIDIKFFQKQILKSKNFDFVKGIFSLFSDEIMSFNEFKQFYAILLSKNYEYILKFISYLLFNQKDEVYEHEYKKNVNLYFLQQLNPDIFLNDLLNVKNKITNMNSSYSREKFYQNFLNNKSFEMKIKNNFHVKFYVPSSKLLKYDNDIIIVCDCDSLNQKNKINNKSEFYEKYVNFYERLKSEFQNIENKNNGIFPYKKLEEMLIDADVDKIFSKLIIRYLKLKIMRLNFLVFKEFMLNVICCRTIAQKAEFIFEILTFPELKEIKEEILEELIKNKNFEIKKISKEEFMNVYLNNVESNELVILLKSFLQNFDKINLIPYLNFGLTPFEPIILKNFVFKKYLKNNKDLHDLCLSRIKTDNYFYVINSEFINQLLEYFNQNNNEKPKIDLNDLNSTEGILKTEKYYKKDFYLIPTDFYYFLEKIFSKEGNDIKLKKVQYNINEYSQETPDPDGKIKSLMFKDENFIYEIEFYYIHCKFFSFKEIYEYVAEKNDDEYKNKKNFEKALIIIKKLYKNNKSLQRSKYFPQKTFCSQILEQAINCIIPYDNNVINPMIYCFYEDNLQIMDLKSILGNYLISDNKENYFCIIILDWKINNKKNSLTYYEKIQDLVEEPEEEKIDDNNDNNNNKQENENKEKNEIKSNENQNKNQTTITTTKNEKEIKEKTLEKSGEFVPNPIGLNNLGNTCYMNSVIQSLINIPLVRDIFLNEKINFFLNKKGKFSNEGKVFEEFYKILDLRWKNSNSNKVFTPKSFKEIIGKLRKEFSSNEQQDANELMNFLLDELHEELNIINERKYIINPENEILHNNDNELSNLYWANNLRRSCSFINALFNFQLKSILTCEKCKKQKITFENNTSLFLPVPLSKLIDININLYRLPFRFKIYYDKINNDFVNFCKKDENKNISNKIELLDKYMLNYIKNISKENEEKKDKKEDTKNKEKNDFEIEDEEDDEEFSFYNKSFPIHIQLNINKTLKLENVITKLISLKNLELEPRDINETNNTSEIIDNGKNELIRSEIKTYTSFIICTIGGRFENVLTYVNKDMIIDNCVQNGGKLYIFEVLNSIGINEVKNYLYNIEKKNVLLVDYNLKNDVKNFNQIYKNSNIKSQNEIISFDNQILFNKNNEFKKNFEFGIRIYHINQKYMNTFLIEPFKIKQIQFYPDFILSNNTENHLNSMLLYDIIWEKYKIYLNKSNKSDDELWWRTKNKNYKVCYPFNISICELVDGALKCAKCPWYKLCPGCILDPKDSSKFIFDVNNNFIIVKWCSIVEKNEIIPNLIKKITVVKEQIIDDDNKDNKNTLNEKNLNDCINIFLEKEKLEDQLKCSNCNKLRTFYKNFQFDKLSQILIVSLKRFKYSSIINNKINTFVKYPLKNLEINNELFDLYGVIHHIGSLNSGHYTCMLKINNKWFLFDDSHFREISEENVVSYTAYILIYINKNKPEEKMYYNILMNIMNQINLNEDKKYLKNNCKEFKELKSDKFYLGEPIKTEYGLGYFNGEDDKFINVKFEFGYGKLYKKNNKIEKQIKLYIGNIPLNVIPLKKINVKKKSIDISSEKKVEQSSDNNNNNNNKFKNISYVNHKININNDKLNEQIKSELKKNRREMTNNKNDCVIF